MDLGLPLSLDGHLFGSVHTPQARRVKESADGVVAERRGRCRCGVFASALAAHAHTANISSSRSCRGHGLYRVEVGFLGTDIERMFAENKPKSDEVDLTEPA
jgi:hypothetical protein